MRQGYSHVTPDLRPRCAWTRNESARAHFRQHWNESTGPQDRDEMEALELPADVFTCNERFMRGVAVGPFYSVPGLWTSLQLPFDLLGSGERVVAFTGDTVSPSGEVIAYPPLHMHHIHVAKQDPRGDANVHWFETHGDYHMDPRRGYRRELPAGYCDVVDGRKNVTVEVQVNDVRYGSDIAMSAEAKRPTVHGPGAHPSAPPIPWYLRLLS